MPQFWAEEELGVREKGFLIAWAEDHHYIPGAALLTPSTCLVASFFALGGMGGVRGRGWKERTLKYWMGTALDDTAKSSRKFSIQGAVEYSNYSL
jgi:hypothetical protein